VKLFSKNSNLCDHNPPTLQTDGRTDGQTDDMRSQDCALCTKVHRAVKIVRKKFKSCGHAFMMQNDFSTVFVPYNAKPVT